MAARGRGGCAASAAAERAGGAAHQRRGERGGGSAPQPWGTAGKEIPRLSPGEGGRVPAAGVAFLGCS